MYWKSQSRAFRRNSGTRTLIKTDETPVLREARMRGRLLTFLSLLARLNIAFRKTGLECESQARDPFVFAFISGGNLFSCQWPHFLLLRLSLNKW